MKNLTNAIRELKNSKLIPDNASEFKSKILMKKLLNYSCLRKESFYRALALIAEKSILDIKYLEQKDFHYFCNLLKRASF